METRVDLKDKVRKVTHLFGEGESWSQYTIVPRPVLLERYREAVANGCYWKHNPMCLVPLIYEHNDGPGRSFAGAPHLYRRSRRFYVFHQRGGLDI